MKNRIIIAEKIDDIGIEMLQKEFDVDVCIGIAREDLLERIENYDALVVRSATKVNAELMDKGKKLKIVGRAGNGIDNIDVPEATKRGIIVANTPDSNTISACEIAIGLMFAQARDIPLADRQLKEGIWGRNSFAGTELFNKTLGIVGVGRIGALMARRMKAMGMKLIGYDPYISDERFKRYDVEKKETLDELLVEADFITIHTPRTEETIGMIGYKEFELMKPTARIANAARGKIIDEEALYYALKNKKIASAGLDVHAKEPRGESPLNTLDNIVLTPHIGANTIAAQKNVGLSIAEQVKNGILGNIVANAVNLPGMNRDEFKHIQPYLGLMESLGKLYYQIKKESVKFVEINYWGDVAKGEVELADIAFLKGLLEPVMGEQVNYINAKICANQAGVGLNVKSFSDNYNNYSNLVRIKIINKDMEEFTLSGAIGTNAEGKLVEINGYEADAKLTNHMLFIQNKDVPGVIGSVGTLVGTCGINVATMQVGRKVKGDKAFMVLNVDEKISKENIQKFNDVEDVIWAKSIQL
ncbi:phosphoglycerate dehydrogenase [Clostridium sediminicola]|uniref:phosphoglycerate dehydrogenase n=1 Tax=Clostridium sediminicola TaxID=3114879 RepID=UPI0031F23F4E